MSSHGYGHHAAEREDIERLDGVERVPLLFRAHMIAIAPGAPHYERSGDPTYVFIEWEHGMVERPYPGSAIWRAVLEHSLAQWDDEGREGREQRHQERAVEAAVKMTPTVGINVDAASSTPSHDLLRSTIETDLARFPSLEAWLHWRDQKRVIPDSSSHS